MKNSAPRGVFITGTDTDVGKTIVTAALARGLRDLGERVGIYKPACSGAETDSAGKKQWRDVEIHHEVLRGEFERARICPQCYKAPLAPPVAARAEGRTIDADLVWSGFEWWRSECDWLLVEGVGGFLCPLTETETIADFAARAKLPALVVARAGLGTINHTLLTIEALERRGLPVLGIVLNQAISDDDAPSRAGNAEEISRRGGHPVLAEIPYQQRQDLPRGGAVLTMPLPDLGKSLVRAIRKRAEWPWPELADRC